MILCIAYLLFSTAIVGGLILLVNIGPGKLLVIPSSLPTDCSSGGLSVDEKKKTY